MNKQEIANLVAQTVNQVLNAKEAKWVDQKLGTKEEVQSLAQQAQQETFDWDHVQSIANKEIEELRETKLPVIDLGIEDDPIDTLWLLATMFSRSLKSFYRKTLTEGNLAVSQAVAAHYATTPQRGSMFFNEEEELDKETAMGELRAQCQNLKVLLVALSTKIERTLLDIDLVEYTNDRKREQLHDSASRIKFYIDLDSKSDGSMVSKPIDLKFALPNNLGKLLCTGYREWEQAQLDAKAKRQQRGRMSAQQHRDTAIATRFSVSDRQRQTA